MKKKVEQVCNLLAPVSPSRVSSASSFAVKLRRTEAVSQSPLSQWRVSRLLDARRSLGESELRALSGKPILMPHDEAFLPAKEALAWRLKRLAA